MNKFINSKKAILFDLDGTLIDSMGMWHDIDVEYLKKFGIKCPDNLQQEIEGKSFYETSLYFKERFGIKDEPETIMAEWNHMAYDIYKNKTYLKTGAYEFLEHVKALKIKTAIATSNSRVLTEIVLESLKIKEMFDVIITANEVEKGKPAPDIYLKAAEKLGVTSEECAVFEDIPQGIMAGKNAGITVFAVDDDYSRQYDKEKRELADYYINDYFDILALE